MEVLKMHDDTGSTNSRFIVSVDADLEELIPLYLEKRQNDVQILQEKLVHGDYETIRLLGHSIKGSGGGYGFDRITDIGRLIEDSALTKSPEGVSRGLDELAEFLQRVEVVYE